MNRTKLIVMMNRAIKVMIVKKKKLNQIKHNNLKINKIRKLLIQIQKKFLIMKKMTIRTQKRNNLNQCLRKIKDV